MINHIAQKGEYHGNNIWFSVSKDNLCVVIFLNQLVGTEIMKKIDVYVNKSDKSGEDLMMVLDELYHDWSGRLQERQYEYLVIIRGGVDNSYMFCLSKSYQTRAGDLVRFLLKDSGRVEKEFSTDDHMESWAFRKFKGDLKLIPSLNECVDLIDSYFQNCDLVDAGTYGENKAEEIEKLPIFQKRKLPRAYVKTVDLTECGSEVVIKSLENQSGVKMIAGDETYIMIGQSGEAYDITRDKFLELYEESDIITMAEFTEKFETQPLADISGEFEVNLREYAKVCMPRTANRVYSKQLSRMTKVFSLRRPKEYYLGVPGDYMTIDVDDLAGIHIVARDVFAKTYKKIQ